MTLREVIVQIESKIDDVKYYDGLPFNVAQLEELAQALNDIEDHETTKAENDYNDGYDKGLEAGRKENAETRTDGVCKSESESISDSDGYW